MPTPPVAELVGRALGGRYRLLAALGAGASAAVYLAEDAALGRRVAVKVLHAGLASDETFLRRFRAEAQAAAGIRHPHVVHVYDWGDDHGMVYVVLELMAGGSLREVLSGGRRLSVEQTASVGIQAAEGLSAAHRQGLAHRDIKPANLLFDEDGRLTVADFGVARALAESSWTEPQGVLLGTARYASPEQAQGQAADGKADVYSLALVLVEALTGRVPFAADTTVATLMGRLGRRVEATPELGPLGPVIEAATDPEPSRRPDASDLARRLGGIARRLPPPAPLPLRLASVPPPVPAAEDDLTVAGPATAIGLLGAGPAVVDDVAAAGPESPGRRRRRWPWMAGAAFLAAVAVALWLMLAVWRVFTPSHPVPNLAGATLTAADHRLAALHLTGKKGPTRYDDSVPAGEVISTSPRAGGEAKEGTTVVLTISAGPAPRTVPSLTGLGQLDAVARLTAAGFGYRIENAYNETIPAGTVVSWQPSQGLQPKGATVTVTISEGPSPRIIPADLVGETFQQASAELTSQGLVVAEQDTYSDAYPAPGTVAGTNPAPGTSVARGATVTLLVSQGPATVTVPDLRGDNVTQAKAALQAKGLTVGSVYGPGGGNVFFTYPQSGEKVKRGTSVDLYTI
ncbi:MAG TPA: PASTA domain-containing protein [Acidimicrobiales bacterium]|nr:PASTA domain-containing protein [Acidimicrobiales bacterium]